MYKNCKIVESCGGWAVHWIDKPAGESLQGWYPTKAEAERLVNA